MAEAACGSSGAAPPGRKRASTHVRTGSCSALEISAIHEELKLIDDRIARLSEELELGVDEGTMQNNSFHEFAVPSPSLVKSSRVVASVRDGELCRMAAEGNVRGLRVILAERHDVNCLDYDGRTPLHLACANGHVAAVELLLEYGANTSLEDDDGKTPHDLALDNGFTDVCALFMISVADAEPESFNMTPSTINNDRRVSQRVMSGFNIMSPLSVALSRDFQRGTGLVLIMVGLPGRGKTYICQRIRRYFLWFGFECEIFSHVRYRKALQPRSKDGRSQQNLTPPSGERVSPSLGTAGAGPASSKERSLDVMVAQCIALEVQTQFSSRIGSVAIIDGTNSTVKRRNLLAQEIVRTGCVKIGQDLVFVEIQNDDPDLIRANVLRAKELQGPDAIEGFEEAYFRNIRDHEKVYTPVEAEREGRLHSFIKVINERTLHLNKINGIVPSRLAYLLHNLKHSPIPIYLTLPGEHEDLITTKLGGNGRLTERGRAYSLALHNFMLGQGLPRVAVLAGSKKRCIHTCFYFARIAHGMKSAMECTVDSFPTLDDINYGDCEGQTLEQVRATLPNTLENLMRDPYITAWPNGESIQQVYMSRLEPHIHDIQASPHPVLVVSHTCIIQGLLTYFDDSTKYKDPEAATEVEVPRHTVLRLNHRGSGRCVEEFDLGPDVDAILAEWHADGKRRTSPVP